MSKNSSSHKHRTVAYLQPNEHRLIEAIAVFNGESKSNVVQIAIREYIKSIPQDKKNLIVNCAKHNEEK